MKNKKITSLALSIIMAASLLPTAMISASAEPNYIWHAEFDSNDDTSGWSWAHDRQGTTELTYMDVQPENGMIELKNTDFESRQPLIVFGADDGEGNFVSSPIGITSYGDLVYEARFKMDGRISSLGKPICSMVENGNYHASIFQKNEKLAYGRGQQNSNNNAAVVTDYSLNSGEWYTYTIHLINNKFMTVEVVSDSGDLYIGAEQAQLPYGGSVKNIANLPLPFTGEVMTTVDYIRIYDNSTLTAPTATYVKEGNVTDINGASDMEEAFTATLDFAYAISERDLAKITLEGNAVVNKTLSSDGRTVTMEISGLEGGCVYNLNTYTIGFNKAASFVFTTKNPEYLLYQTEFKDGDTGYTFRVNNNTTAVTPTVANGILSVPYQNAGQMVNIVLNNAPDISEKEDISIETRVRYNANSPKEDGRLKETGVNYPLFTIPSESEADTTVLSTKGAFQIAVDADSKMKFGSRTSLQTTDYDMYSNRWYTITVNINNVTAKGSVTIVDEEGNAYTSREVNLYNNSKAVLDYIKYNYRAYAGVDIDYIKITDNSLMPSLNVLYNNEDLDNASSVPVSFEADIVFGSAIKAEEFENAVISVDNGGVVTKGTLSENGKSAKISISGLNGRTAYTLTVPQIGINKGKNVTFTTSEAEAYWIYRAEFDGKDPDVSGWSVDSSAFNNPAPNNLLINKDNSGYLKATSAGNRYLYLVSSELGQSTATNMVYETKIKYTPGSNNIFKEDENGNKVYLYSGKSFMDIGSFKLYTDNEGNLVYANSGNDNTGNIVGSTSYTNINTGYKIISDKWYTFRFEINNETKYVNVSVVDEDGRRYDSETPIRCDTVKTDTLRFGYTYQIVTTMDYLRIWDDRLVPKPSVTYDDVELDGQKNVTEGKTAVITFPYAIEEADLINITLNGETAVSELSDNNTVNVTLDGIGTRAWNVLSVSKIGENKAVECRFRSADEPKYLYRAEFDGNDDDTSLQNNSGNQITNDSEYISNGVLNAPINNRMHFRFENTGNSLDCTGLENVLFETRIKYGSDGVVNDGTTPVQTDFAIIRIIDGAFAYNCIGSNSTTGTKFVVYDEPFEVLRDEWYTFKFNINYNTHTYTVAVSDEHGNVANSGSLKFLNNSVSNYINTVSYTWTGATTVSAPFAIDYLRISDEEYGKAKVTYSNGIDLNNAAMIPTEGEQFTITCAINTSASTNGITLEDAKGNSAEFDAVANDNIITITPNTLSYDTEYSLFIPKTATGALANQTVTFKTVWNENAEFVYPDGFEQGKFTPDNKLNVVFFGGSITNQNGWRIVTSDWFKNKYGVENVNAVNASVGGSGASYGWVRINRDVISQDPDIVFIEFATNDANTVNAGENIESLVRTLKSLDKPPVIIFVYTTVINFTQNNNSIALQEAVAKHYGIPSINIRDYMMTLYNSDPQFANDWDNKVYLSDGTHPTSEASALYGEYVNSLLESNSSKYFVYSNDVPALNSGAKDYYYDYENVNHRLSGIGDSYSFDVFGDEFAVEFSKASTAGVVSIEVDGRTVEAVVNTYKTSGPDTQIVITGIGEGKHTVKITVVDPQNITVGGNDAVIHTIYKLHKDAVLFNDPIFDSDSVTAATALTATVSYSAVEELPFVIAIALYDENGKLTGLQCVETTTDPSGEEKIVSAKITPKQGDTKAKAFVWDGLNTMKPYTRATETN